MERYDQILLEFRQFVETRHLVKENQIVHVISWTRRFLVFQQKNDALNFDALLDKFADSLRGGSKIEEWQVRQA